MDVDSDYLSIKMVDRIFLSFKLFRDIAFTVRIKR